MNKTLKILERAATKITGETPDQLRRMSIDDRRAMIEKKTGKKMQVRSWFPFIGRGNVLRDHLITHEEVEKMVDAALTRQ